MKQFNLIKKGNTFLYYSLVPEYKGKDRGVKKLTGEVFEEIDGKQ